MTVDCTSADAAAAVFAPDSDHAWEWAFPDPEHRAAWRRVSFGRGAVEMLEWSETTVTADEAGAMILCEFTLPDALRWNAYLWTGHGSMSPGAIDALGWRGKDPTVVYTPWADIGIGDPNEAHAWAQTGLTPDHASRWRAAGITTPEKATDAIVSLGGGDITVAMDRIAVVSGARGTWL